MFPFVVPLSEFSHLDVLYDLDLSLYLFCRSSSYPVTLVVLGVALFTGLVLDTTKLFISL